MICNCLDCLSEELKKENWEVQPWIFMKIPFEKKISFASVEGLIVLKTILKVFCKLFKQIFEMVSCFTERRNMSSSNLFSKSGNC